MKKHVNSIHKTLSRSVCQGWDRSFLNSILAQIEDNVELSKRQLDALHKVLNRNTAEHEEKHKTWEPIYMEKYRADAVVLANYHAKHAYFNEEAKIILDDRIPVRKKYMRMHNNKYSQKVLAESQREPRLSLGTHVKPRSSFNKYKNVDMGFLGDYESERHAVERFMKDGAFIVGVEKYVFSAARGAKRYKLLAPGSRHLFIVEERFLKRV